MPTALITGCDHGLGFDLARALLGAGWRVHACALAPESPLPQTLAREGDVSLHRLDVTAASARAALVSALGHTPLDWLINAAGIFGDRFMYDGAAETQRFGASRWAEWDRVFTVNLYGAMAMSEALVANVAASQRRVIATLSSTMGSLALGHRGGGYYAYRLSKTGVNMMMRAMAQDLRPLGIIAVPLHPGWVRTPMGGPAAAISPASSAAGMVRVLAGLDLSKSGRFWAWDGSEVPW
jgi:NAD(P)-dependent dehydrogenase (short-subunit alcohol dehydrogenase family)